MKRSFRSLLRLIVMGILSLAAQTQGAAAAVINVTYAGIIDFSVDPAFPVGTTFSGTFTYRTDLLVDIDGVAFRTFFLDTAALTVNIGGNSYANTNAHPLFHDFLQVWDSSLGGQLTIGGIAMGGTGPLDDGSIYVIFNGSSDPVFDTLEPPFPFPTDFNDTTFIINSVTEVRGTLTDYKAENIPDPVPEPGTGVLALTSLALVCLRAGRRRMATTRPSGRQ